MIKALLKNFREQTSGQGLAEVAIFLPVILIMIAGVVEVSNVLVAQNRVSAASRAATGYGATNFVGEEWNQVGLWSNEMADVARTNVTDTLDLNADRWDIWTIKATVNLSGDGFSEWVPIHAFGNYEVMSNEEWNSTDIRGDVLTALREQGDGLASNIQIAATVAYHDRQSLLGLKSFNLGPLFRVRGLTVMRIGTNLKDNGCAILPITLYIENYSLYPEGTLPEDMIVGGEAYDPNIKPGGWDPGHPGQYLGLPDDDYRNASGGNHLSKANKGDLFEARVTNSDVEPPGTLGTFGWASWDGQSSAGSLESSLAWPGNLSLYPGAVSPQVNYVNPDDADDFIPSTDDWVMNGPGLSNSIDLRNLLDGYVTSGRTIQILAYDHVRDSGGNYEYQIAGFPLVRLRGYQNKSSDKRILVEFMGWEAECVRQISN